MAGGCHGRKSQIEDSTSMLYVNPDSRVLETITDSEARSGAAGTIDMAHRKERTPDYG